ncbi:MAG: type II toxin-antitoxin system VapC family toxin [Bacteroidota bacterium]|nr:type II toxin-antitoxin system VapC family toxin [Bacteroidota bacterium]
MNYLFDTHTLLWLLEGNKSISEKIKNILIDTSSIKYISAATFWEIAIKVSIGKLQIDYVLEDLPLVLIRPGFEFLSITEKHALAVAKLPSHHKDPFDPIMIAQTQLENLTLMTRDNNISKYDVPVIW